MNDKIFYGVVAMAVLLIIALIALKFIFRKQVKWSKEEKVTQLLYQLAYYAVCIVEKIYKDGNGQKKLDMATKIMRSKIPNGLSNLVSDELIHKYIEKALSNLQVVFKSKKADEISMLNKIIDAGIKSPDAKGAIEMAQNLRDSKGYVEGYIEGRSNLKGDSNIVAGVRAGAKF